MIITQKKYEIRWMVNDDLTQIEKIDCPIIWTRQDILVALEDRNVIGMSAEADGAGIAGWMLYKLNKRSITVLMLAVHQDCRRQGVGTALVQKLKSKLGGNTKRRALLVHVDDNLLNSHLFLKKNDFFCIEVIRNGVQNADTYIFRYGLPEGEAEPLRGMTQAKIT